MKSQASELMHPESLQSKTLVATKIESPLKALRVLHGRLVILRDSWMFLASDDRVGACTKALRASIPVLNPVVKPERKTEDINGGL